MIEEFEKLTGIYPSAEAYTVIESYYLDYPGTKQDFCKAFRNNTDGLAQQIQRELNSIHWKKEQTTKAAHAKMASEIETLKKQLEREQEWRPYEDKDNVQQGDYEKLLTAGDTKVMTDDEAKDLLYNWFGFAKEKVQILRCAPFPPTKSTGTGSFGRSENSSGRLSTTPPTGTTSASTAAA